MIPAVAEIAIPEIREEVYRRFLDLLLKRDGPRITPVPEGIDVQCVFFLAAPGMLILDFNENLINFFPGVPKPSCSSSISSSTMSATISRKLKR